MSSRNRRQNLSAPGISTASTPTVSTLDDCAQAPADCVTIAATARMTSHAKNARPLTKCLPLLPRERHAERLQRIWADARFVVFTFARLSLPRSVGCLDNAIGHEAKLLRATHRDQGTRRQRRLS